MVHFAGEITQQMLKNSSFPGSNNGTGLFQTIVGLKVSLHSPAFPHPLLESLDCATLCSLYRNMYV